MLNLLIDLAYLEHTRYRLLGTEVVHNQILLSTRDARYSAVQ